MLSLLKVVMNLLLEGLNLFNQSGIHDMSVCRRNIYTFFAILSTCFCWIEGAWTEAVVVAVPLFTF
jgi:hypothetical protein